MTGPRPLANCRARRAHAAHFFRSFLDSEIPALLGEPLDGLIFPCVGVPDNTSRPAGPPGSPTQVRTVRPRE